MHHQKDKIKFAKLPVKDTTLKVNPLLIKPEVGRAKSSVYNLPSANHTYGTPSPEAKDNSATGM